MCCKKVRQQKDVGEGKRCRRGGAVVAGVDERGLTSVCNGAAEAKLVCTSEYGSAAR
jgi:hypothetical protein